METFLQNLTYREWLVVLALACLVTHLITSIVLTHRGRIKTANGWADYKSLLDESELARHKVEKRCDVLLSSNQKLTLELKALQRKLDLDEDQKSHIFS